MSSKHVYTDNHCAIDDIRIFKLKLLTNLFHMSTTIWIPSSQGQLRFTRSIPNELTHVIIDHLSDDKHSLANCGVVCRSWVARSQFHLFRCVCVYAGNVSGFAALLNTRSCMTFASYVNSLQLSEAPRKNRTEFKLMSVIRILHTTYSHDLFI
jgi:hypothetical protein